MPAEFLRRLKRLGEELGVPLPKGASKDVEETGRNLIAKLGPDALPKVGKMHFRTSYRILGLPEPPRKEWRPK